jgi:hypothetical protein
LLSLICTSIVLSQPPPNSTSRRGKLFLTVGTEYRITPIYQGQSSQLSFGTLVDAQNSGAAFNYGFDFFVTKNLSLNFAHSLRYSLLINEIGNVENAPRFQASESTIISDFHFYADYHLKIFKEGELFLRVGTTFANRGTNFTEKTTFFNNNNEPIATLISTENYHYTAWNFALGYKKNGLSLTGGVYTSAVTNYFDDGSSFTVPYVSLKYDLFRF